jgi:hypothetical protein
MRGGLAATVLALAVFGSALPVAAEPAAKPGLFSSAETNFEYALAEVCLPYVTEGKDDALKAGWGVSSIGWGPQNAFKTMGLQAHLVGIKGRINVAVGVVRGARQCLIEINQGNPSAYRAVLQKVAAASPLAFAPGKSPYPSHDFAFRDFYCAGDKTSGVAILASFSADGGRPHPSLVSVLNDSRRSARCDTEGVPDPGLPTRPMIPPPIQPPA